MDTLLLIDMLVGYVTVPLVSLANRRRWPAGAKFACAAAIAAGAATLTLLAGGQTITRAAFLATLAVTFGVQQTAWHLDKWGLGSSSMNERLLDRGV